MNADHRAHSLGLGVEGRMFQKASDKLRRLLPSHVQPNQTVTAMRPVRAVEVLIEAEESRVGQPVKDWNEIPILGPGSSDLDADNAEADTPLTQPEPLPFGEIFVEHQH